MVDQTAVLEVTEVVKRTRRVLYSFSVTDVSHVTIANPGKREISRDKYLHEIHS